MKINKSLLIPYFSMFAVFFCSTSFSADDGAFQNEEDHQMQPSFATRYFSEMEPLRKAEQWATIVSLGEEALRQDQLTQMQKFEIHDQLVSTYYRLGNFEKAKDHAVLLQLLGESLSQPELVATSLYKLSATMRGEAGSVDDSFLQDQLFAEARQYVLQALEICRTSCPGDHSLKAKVLFNAGAVECDDPQGNYFSGIERYEEALQLFTALQEEDYRERTFIRLGKAYLLIGEVEKSRQIIEMFKQLQPELRTQMHLDYLNVQVCIEEGQYDKALQIAQKGLEVAIQLQAQADRGRFEHLIRSLMNVNDPE